MVIPNGLCPGFEGMLQRTANGSWELFLSPAAGAAPISRGLFANPDDALAVVVAEDDQRRTDRDTGQLPVDSRR
jgi:hypothetical protein